MTGAPPGDMAMAGFLAGPGRLSLVGAIVASTIGSTAGALALYCRRRRGATVGCVTC